MAEAPHRSIEEKKLSINQGALYAELNTILGRIRRRAIGEPTTAERERIEVIRAELQKLKRGDLSG